MKILMVCLGNICRSPIAEGVMKKYCAQLNLSWQIDSAGTINFHEGESPDIRSIITCKKHGIDISKQRAAKIDANELEQYDYVFAMDSQNLIDIQKQKHNKLINVFAILPFTNNKKTNVPDPYYGNDDDFENVYQLLDEACLKAINKILE
jgi:protein-tyrosine phosphatase